MTTASSDDPWSISVKTVGGGITTDDDESNTNSAGEKLFVVTVSPEDRLASLHDQIEGATGLKASQQRLIYRGRLIGKHDGCGESLEPRLKDIAGLGDGQTIHLVKKRDSAQEGSDEEPNEETSSSSHSANRSSLDSDILGGSSGSGGGSLLAALLGLSSLTEENEEQDTARQRWGWRSSRLGRSRRPHYRLTAEDLEVPDPGSMEPVRQGLMTLHTLLPHARLSEGQSPLEANREWYRGQWIDCRDTVNQWLEATVVEIVNPQDILPPRQTNTEQTETQTIANRRRRLPYVASDPAVSAHDLEGRRKLLMEPCEPGDLEEEEGVVSGFRQRDNNEGIQLLLIHYNGWPHRWDEWIRSDAERIRPFRTRTRHPSVSSSAAPSPQSVFNDAPGTHIRDGTEAEDRTALLPEISRAVAVVSDLLAEVVSHAAPAEVDTEVRTSGGLPWIQHPDSDKPDDDSSLPELEPSTGPDIISNIVEAMDEELVPFGPPTRPAPQPQYNRRQLQNLASLVDRLGRTLTEAAPHLASLAASLPEELPPTASTDVDTALPNDVPELEEGHHPPLGGLLSLWSRERRRQNATGDPNSEVGGTGVDPDHVDYVSGLVNTSRGEVRSGPRSRSQPDDVASLLGAYLAAASLGSMTGSDDNDNNDDNGNTSGLGRLLRERGTGGGGGGIDIHIHAVVTAPGITPGGLGGLGGLGLATLGGGTPATTLGGTRNLFSSTRDRSSRVAPTSILRSRHVPTSSFLDSDEEDTLGLFAELYSENPTPVDPNGSPEPGARRAIIPEQPDTHRDDSDDFLARISGSNGSNGLSLRNDSLSLSSTRRNRRFSGQNRQGSERRSSGWSRLFRRRSRSHRSNHDDF